MGMFAVYDRVFIKGLGTGVNSVTRKICFASIFDLRPSDRRPFQKLRLSYVKKCDFTAILQDLHLADEMEYHGH